MRQIWVVASRPYVEKVVDDRFFHERADAKAFLSKMSFSHFYCVYEAEIGIVRPESEEGTPSGSQREAAP